MMGHVYFLRLLFDYTCGDYKNYRENERLKAREIEREKTKLYIRT